MSIASARTTEPLSDVKAINEALEKAAPGDTIVIKDGRYEDAHITLTASGEEGRLITLTAQTPGKVTFTERSRIVLAGKYQHVTGFVFMKNIAGTAVDFEDDKARNCRLSHCAFIESGNPQSTFTHLVNIGENCTDNEVDHCYFAQSLSMSVGTRYGAKRPHIHHNWFRDIVSRASNGQEAIQLQGFRLQKEPPHSPIKEGDHRLFALVEYNLFDGACGDDEIISVKSENNLIRYNTFLKHPTANKGGLNLRGANNNVVDSNSFFGTVAGIRISGSGHRVVNNYMEDVTHGILLTAGGLQYATAENNLIANNTVVAKQSALSIGVFYGLTRRDRPGQVNNIMPTGNKFLNNILASNSPKGLLTIKGHGKMDGNEFQANIIASRSAGDAALPHGPGLIAADFASLVQKDGRYIIEDPRLIGQGVPVEDLEVDFAGRKRQGTPTIGCEEVGAGPAVRQPVVVTAKDVGPEWMGGDYTVVTKAAILDEFKNIVHTYASDAEFLRQLKETIEVAANQYN